MRVAAPLPERIHEILIARAVELRQRGLSYSDIEKLVPVSRATLSLWLRDVPLTPEYRARLQLRKREAAQRRARALRKRRLDKEARIKRASAVEVGPVTSRDLFVAGVLAYAAEGTKNKPWGGPRLVQFTNSDPNMITLYLRWLDLIGVDRARIAFRVAIHQDADVEGAVKFWAQHVGCSPTDFLPTTLKRHNPKTPRRNIGPAYRGCLVVTVRRSIDLNRRIDGWFRALVEGLEQSHPNRGASLRFLG
jgi:hypothetical protein